MSYLDVKNLQRARIREKNRSRKRQSIWNRLQEKVVETIFFTCACVAVLSVLVISLYILYNGWPAFSEIGVREFLFGREWRPTTRDLYGIFPMIIGSVYATMGAILLGVPIGVMTAMFLAEIAPAWVARIVRPAVELLAGIPSVVYGFFGLMTLVPLIRNHIAQPGNSLLAVCVVLGIMILPTVISISEASIRAVPSSYKEGSLAMGASQIQTLFKVTLPAARSGVLTAVILGIGRAVGETMAVILVAGNAAMIPRSLAQPIRTLTGNVALEMSYATGVHRQALFATGVVLFLFIMVLNVLVNVMASKAGGQHD